MIDKCAGLHQSIYIWNDDIILREGVDGNDEGSSRSTADSNNEMGYKLIRSILGAVAETSVDLLLEELYHTTMNKIIRMDMKKGIMHYLYAAGFLSFAGREIDKNTVEGVLRAVGMAPDGALVDAVLNSHIKSHLVYIYASYFLLVNGVDPTVERVLDVVGALGLPQDRERAAFVLRFIRKKAMYERTKEKITASF